MHSAWIELDSRGRLSNIKQWTENACSRLKRFIQVFHFTVHRWWWWRSCLRRDCDVSQINYMYAQYVKNTMQSLNIADVTKDQRFPWTVGVTSSLSFKFLPRFRCLNLTVVSPQCFFDRVRIQTTPATRSRVCSALPSGTPKRTKS